MRSLILMSGGTSPVINASLAGLLETLAQLAPSTELLVTSNGLSDVLEERFDSYSLSEFRSKNWLALLPGSSVIGTSRVGRLDEQTHSRLFSILDKRGVEVVFNIGGNGTLQQSKVWAQHEKCEQRIISIPKTVDNDLGDVDMSTVVVTPGYLSAANYIARLFQSLNIENIGAKSHEPVLILQTFGRATGFLAAAPRLADPDRQSPLILALPEAAQPPEQLLEDIKELVSQRGRAVVSVSEGYPWPGLTFPTDPAGQAMYGSAQSSVAQSIAVALGDDGLVARSVLPGVLQRQDASSVLAADRTLAFYVGVAAARYGVTPQSGSGFIGIRELKTEGVALERAYPLIPFHEIGEFHRRVPPKWLSPHKADITDEYLAYVAGLCSDITVPDTFLDSRLKARSISQLF